MLLLVFLCLLVLILLAVIRYSKRKFNYWKRQNVPYIEPKLIFGNYSDYILLRKYVGFVAQEICRKFPNEPCIGTFYGTEPALLIQDPELLKLITTKDYYYFSSREVSKYTHREVFTQNMFFTYGDRWRVIRQNFTPMFSSAKMRNMFYLIENCAHQFEKLLDSESKATVEARLLMGRFTMDCIGSCIFGVESNVMKGDANNNPFKRIGDAIFELTNYRGFSLVSRAIWPAIYYQLGFKVFPTEINDFFYKLITDVFKSRNYEASARNDLIDLTLSFKKNDYIVGDAILNMKDKSSKKVTLKADDELIVAQCIAFFAAGYETSATTLSYTLFELAKDKRAQKLAQDEVDAYLKRKNNKLGYDCVSELPYLEACIDEALRLYPVLGNLTREVVEDYKLPSGIFLEKGTRVHIPVYHLHHDPALFPDPEQFRPERFLGDEKKNIKPYTYFPFGEGPRICIGMRFAKMQMLAGLVTLLKKYSVVRTTGDLNLDLDPRGIVTQPRGSLPLRLECRHGWEARQFETS